MQPPLTDGARAVLDRAQSEARDLGQEFVGSEHLALAILHARSSLASRILHAQQVDAPAVRSALLAKMGKGEDESVVTGLLPLSPKAQRILNSAIVMSQSLREPKMSTRVLLLALLDETEAPFSVALRSGGADTDALRQALAEKPSQPET